MKNKNIVSGLLSAMLSISLCIPAFAEQRAAAKDRNIYTWQENAEGIWTGGLEKNGGSWNGYAENDVEFDDAEKAIKFIGKGYKYFSCGTGGTIEKGQLDISLKFKTNGDYFGIILDGGGGESNSTVATTVHPWGSWNNGPTGKNLTGQITVNAFPWNGRVLTESNELGQHTDSGFGEWLTVKISARPSEKKYDLTVETQSGETIVQNSALDMKSEQICGIVFAHYDEMTWNAVTYVKDIAADYKAEWEEPKADTSLYSWPQNPKSLEDVLTDGLKANGGSWYGNRNEDSLGFNEAEKAILLDSESVGESDKVEYFSYDIGGALTKGQINLSLRFKTNGDYFGIILDSGSGQDSSTAALALRMWDYGQIMTGAYPYGETVLGSTLEIEGRGENAFGAWLTAEISARPGEKKYSVVVKSQDGKILAEGYNLKMKGNRIRSVVFSHYEDDGTIWGPATYVKDINLDYRLIRPELDAQSVKLTDITGAAVKKLANVSTALKSIALDFKTSDVVTAQNEPITLKKAGGGAAFELVGSVKNDIYMIEDIPVLERNSEYILTVPGSAATSDGNKMGEDFVLRFTTGSDEFKTCINGLLSGETEVTSLDELKAASRVTANIQMVNEAETEKSYVLTVFYYCGDKMLHMEAIEGIVGGGGIAPNVEFSVSENASLGGKLDNVTKVSVCMWNNLTDMIPYCGAIDLTAKSAN